jgi:hypothetical protein
MTHAACACGAHRILLPGPPPRVTLCFCTDCQRRSGGPFGIAAYYAADGLELPALPHRTRTSDAGRWLREHHCAVCGSVLFYAFALREGVVGIPLGLIDGAAHLAPDRAVFCRNKPPWVSLPPGVPAFEAGSDGPRWTGPAR